MFRRQIQDAEALSCSFCRKSQDSVKKLIGSPSDHPGKAYICDECVAVCASILEEQPDPPDEGYWNTEPREWHPLLDHPLTPQLLTSVMRWIQEESSGADASEEMAKVRAIAIRLIPRGAGHPAE